MNNSERAAEADVDKRYRGLILTCCLVRAECEDACTCQTILKYSMLLLNWLFGQNTLDLYEAKLPRLYLCKRFRPIKAWLVFR